MRRTSATTTAPKSMTVSDTRKSQITQKKTNGLSKDDCKPFEIGVHLKSTSFLDDGANIQITRGAFSDPLLSMCSPMEPHDSSISPPSQSSKSSPSPLQAHPSPTPPPPPRTPIIVTQRKSAIRQNGLHPRPSRPQSMLPRETKQDVLPQVEDKPSVTMKQPNIDTTINTVDILAKKLRQQASELTHVYEQMEERDVELNRVKQERDELQLRLEQKKKRVSIVGTPSSQYTSTRKESINSSAVRRPASAKTTRETKEPEGKLHETLSEELQSKCTIERFEETLLALQHFHEVLRSKDESVSSIKSDSMQQEQQLYIRVLEEAVHLKAEELQITGHEELLIVLAELRHTIYRQEQELIEIQSKLTKAVDEAATATKKSQETEAKCRREENLRHDEHRKAVEKEAALHKQIEQVQSALHQEHTRLRQEQQVQVTQAQLITSLQGDIRTKMQEQREIERLLANTKKDLTTVQGELEATRAQLTQVQSTRQDLAHREKVTSQQIEELKAFQEGLLHSIDQLVAKEDDWKHEINVLRSQTEWNEQLQDELRATTSSMEHWRTRYEVLMMSNEEMETNRQEYSIMKALVVESTRKVARALQDDAKDQLSNLQYCCDTLLPAVQAVPWLSQIISTFSESVKSTATMHQRHNELLERCKAAEATVESTRIQAEGLQNDLELSQAQSISKSRQLEKLNLQLAVLTEQVGHSQAQQDVEKALSDQILELERIVKVQKMRICDILEQNQELLTLETSLAEKISNKENEVEELRLELLALSERAGKVEPMEMKLEQVATFVEEQNEWNQQITIELENFELENVELGQQIESLRTRDEVLTLRFRSLFQQYLQFVRTNQQRLSRQVINGSSRKNQFREMPTLGNKMVYDDALATKDVLQLMQVFPMLVEEYVASTVLGIQTTTTIANQNGRKDHNKNVNPVSAIKPSLSVVHPKHESEPTDDIYLQNDLQQIINAFDKYKC